MRLYTKQYPKNPDGWVVLLDALSFKTDDLEYAYFTAVQEATDTSGLAAEALEPVFSHVEQTAREHFRVGAYDRFGEFFTRSSALKGQVALSELYYAYAKTFREHSRSDAFIPGKEETLPL